MVVIATAALLTTISFPVRVVSGVTVTTSGQLRVGVAVMVSVTASRGSEVVVATSAVRTTLVSRRRAARRASVTWGGV